MFYIHINSSEYKQQKDSLKAVGEQMPRESSKNVQRNSSLRASQTNTPDRPLDPKNRRSSLRKSNEYTQQKDYLSGVEEEIPKEYSKNGQRDSSGRTSQAQPPDLQNGRSSLRKSNEYTQQDNYVKPEDDIAPAEGFQRGSSNNSQRDSRVSQTSQSLKTFEQKEDLEETKRSISEEAPETCQPIRYSCKRLDCTQYPPCMIKPKGYKNLLCSAVDFVIPKIRHLVRTDPVHPKETFDRKEQDRPSLRKSNEYKQEDNDLNGVGTENMPEEYSNNSQGDASGRASETQRPSKSADIQNGRSSLRKSNEYKQQDNYLKTVEEETPKEYSNNSQRDSSGRVSQTQQPDKPLDLKNGRSSFRKSGEYKQQNDYLKGVENEAPIESSNNSQRVSSGRGSQAQPLDKPLELPNGRSSLRKSNEYKQEEDGIKTEDEIAPAENVQRGSSNNQGDARVSQTRQSLKTFDQKEDLEETKRSISEDVSKTCQPIRYSCKRLDCTQYPPCMIKPKGYKQPAVFSCKLCNPKDTASCSDRSNVCKELQDYLQSTRNKRKRESCYKNQDQPKEAFDSKEQVRPSLRKSNEYKQQDNDLNGVGKENMPEEYSNNSQGDARGRTSQNYQPVETFDSKEGRSSLRKSSEYKQRDDTNGRASQSYQPDEALDYKGGRSSLRKSNEYKQGEDSDEKVSNNQGDARGSLSKEARSSLRKSNEYKQRENVFNNQDNANGRMSQSYQPVETMDSKEARSSLRKSNEYKQQDNYVKTENEITPAGDIQRGSSKSSQGDARVSRTSQALKGFDHAEDSCSSREEIPSAGNVSEEGSQTRKYCCEPVDLTKCQPCLMKTKTGKPPRIYRCWPYDSNQGASSKRKSNACSGKTYECKQPVICCCKPSSNKCKEFECVTPCEDQPCSVKIKRCKIPAKCCCTPCQPKPDLCCLKKTNKCKEPIKYRSRQCDSKEDPLDLMKTQVIIQLIDYLKDLKVQLTSSKMKQNEFFDTNKAEASQRACQTCPCKRSSQVKDMPDKEDPNLMEKNGPKHNENNGLKNLNKEVPSEALDKHQEKGTEITPPPTNTLRKSSDTGQQETPHLPASLIQKISSDAVQPDVSERKEGGCTPSKNKLQTSTDSCNCQAYRTVDPKLDVPGSTTKSNLRKPHNNNVKYTADIKDIEEEEIPHAKDSQNSVSNANKQDLKARTEDNAISKNILSGRLESSEKSSQTEQTVNMQNAKAPCKHMLNIAPITLKIPLKLVIDSQEGQSKIIETDIIFEATSGGQNQGSIMSVPKTTMPMNKTIYMQDSKDSGGFLSCFSESSVVQQKIPTNKTPYMANSKDSDAFFSCLSVSGVMEVDRLRTIKSQNKCGVTTTTKPNQTPLNKTTTHMQDDSDDSDVFYPCLSDSDIIEVEVAPNVKTQNIVELEQQVKEGTNSCTIIPTIVPPVTNSVNQQIKTEIEKPLKTPATSAAMPEVKVVEEQMLPKAVIQTQANVMPLTLEGQTLPKAVIETQANVMHVTLPAYVEPKSGGNAKSARYSTPIDYQGIPVNISKRDRAQSKSAEPAVADKATGTGYVSGRQLRNEMRMEIQEQLKELLEFENTNAKHKYDAEEREAILLELHKLFNPDMVDLLPPEIIKEITLTSIRFLVEPELLSSTDNEIAKLSENQAQILEDLRHIINPKSVQSDGARKYRKESKFKILENLCIILNARKKERLSDADIRQNRLNDLRSLLDAAEVSRSTKLEQGPSTGQEKDQKFQQQSPEDIKESLMSDLRQLLDANPLLQTENKENPVSAVKKESLSNNSSYEPLTDSNRPIVTRKVQTAPPRRTLASLIMPKRYSQRFSTPERRKTYKDLQSSSSEDFFLEMHDN
ncbi:hypothetical protein DOY81_010433 [Sarcophaga bullata]|nr:hypothetical protein DOY81_010433 [Sarcophaga bullata]